MMNLDVDLGKRQQEIAEHIAFGYSIKETADILDTPINTVKATLKAIYSKLGIQKATELAKYIYCRKFGLPLALCEPARKIIATCFLFLVFYTIYEHDESLYPRRTRRAARIERVITRKD